MAVAIFVGIIIIIVFYTASDSVFSGNGKLIFNSFLFLLASYLLTVMAFAMFKFKNYEKKWEMKLAGNSHHQVRACPFLREEPWMAHRDHGSWIGFRI